MSKRPSLPTDVPKALAHIQGMDVKAILRRRGVYLRQRTNIELKEAALPLAEVLVKNHAKNKNAGKGKPRNVHKTVDDQESQRFISFDNETALKYWEKQIHSVTIIEEHFDKAVKDFLTNSVFPKAINNVEALIDAHKSVKAQNKALESFVSKQVFDEDDEQDLINQAQVDLEPLLANMAVVAGQDAYKLIGIDDPYIRSDALTRLIRGNVQKFTKSMLDTDQEHLIRIIQNGIESGDSVQQISSAIKDSVPSYSSMQAQRVTRTEILRASNQSTLDAFKQSGIVEGKQWLTAGADDECAIYEGQTESLDSNFYSDASEFQDGDPPLHPNCRCVLIPVLLEDSEKASFSNEQRAALQAIIKDLESQIDKRSKAFKELKRKSKEEKADDLVYIKSLEKYLKIESDESKS
jgi:SPP1 gp7 family putative phage head morphogenesis protein